MEYLELIISLASACVGLIVTVATLIAKFAKSAKAKKAAQQTLEICSVLVPYIQEAEKFTNYSGEEKKAFVMTKARQFALNSGMKMNEDQVSETVDELVKLSKAVNVGKAQKTTITIPSRSQP